MQLHTAQVGHGDGRRKKSKTGEDGNYRAAQVGHGEDGSYRATQVGHGDGRRKKARLGKMVATTQLRLAL